MGNICTSETIEDNSRNKETDSNIAVMFIKPHANTPQVKDLVLKHLREHNIYLLSQSSITAKEILEKGIIDSHYGVIAANALQVDPSALQVSADAKTKFKEVFGLEFQEAASNGTLLNLAQYREKYPDESDASINKQWLNATAMKFSPGTYAGRLENGSIVVNAFYGAMRAKYTADGVVVHCFVVGFEETSLPWKKFRAEVIGATDPTKAPTGSLREKILSNFESLGLNSQPNMSDNGVHASAGPIEGLVERSTWLSRDLLDDTFAKTLLKAGVSGELVKSLCANDVITVSGETGPAFDVLEDLDSSTVVNAAKHIMSQL